MFLGNISQDCYQIMQMVYYNTKHQRLPEFWPPILEIWLNSCVSTVWSPKNIKKNTKNFAIPVNRHFHTKLWHCFDFTRLEVGAGLLSNWYVHSHFRYNQIIPASKQILNHTMNDLADTQNSIKMANTEKKNEDHLGNY